MDEEAKTKIAEAVSEGFNFAFKQFESGFDERAQSLSRSFFKAFYKATEKHVRELEAALLRSGTEPRLARGTRKSPRSADKADPGHQCNSRKNGGKDGESCTQEPTNKKQKTEDTADCCVLIAESL